MTERLFHFTDTKMKYFQVKEGNKYQILVQESNGDNEIAAFPFRYDGSALPHSIPVSNENTWCLDRCKGVIDVWDKDSIFVSSDDEIVEVEPVFKRKYTTGGGYPSGEIKVRNFHHQAEVLLPLHDPIAELNKLVGCDNIKQRLKEFKSLAEYNKACLHQSPKYPVMKIFLHSVFYGNPGTGKTTVCRLYGSLLKEAGLLSKGHVVVVDRSTFVGDSFGDLEAVIEQLLDMSNGGILMFDEAYLLEGSHRDDPNQMVLPLLLPVLADEKKKDFAVVICGYKDKLDQMIDKNPGLYSRFVNRFEFKDYTQEELTEIGIRYLKSFGHTFSLDGLASFKEELAAEMSGSNKASWANARSVKNMIEHIYIQRAKRYSKDGKIDRVITAEDICSIPYERRRRIGFSA